MSTRAAWRLIAGLLVLIALTVAATSAATAAQNSANLRVTAKTQTTVSLAWNSFGNSDYVLHFWENGNWTRVTLPRTQRSYTWTGLIPNVQYFFWIKSGTVAGNSVMVTTDPTGRHRRRPGTRGPAPSPPPRSRSPGTRRRTTPVFASTGSRSVPAGESRLDRADLGDARGLGPVDRVHVHCDGAGPRLQLLAAQQRGLRDDDGEHGHDAADRADEPARLGRGRVRRGRAALAQSTDNQDPQSAIRYRVFINGEPDPIGIDAIGTGRWITYGVVDGTNTFFLRAIDSAGNVSAPSNSFPILLNIC